MTFPQILLLLAAICISHCIYLAISLRLLGRRPSNTLISILLFLLAIRTGKSVISLWFPATAYMAALAGLISMIASGPFVLVLIQQIFVSDRPFPKRDIFHFTPILFVLPLFFVRSWYWVSVEYYLFTASTIGYLITAAVYLLRHKINFMADDLSWHWSWIILFAFALLCISFSIQLFFYDALVYTVNVVLATFVVYGISIYGVRKTKLFQTPGRKKATDTNDFGEAGERIRRMFEQDQIFTDADLTISKLATQLKLPAYFVSKAINQNFGCTFPEFISGYRVRKAEQLLVSKGDMLSVEGIAYECGYNSLSVFYASFKKANKITPAEFRNRNSKGSSMKIA